MTIKVNFEDNKVKVKKDQDEFKVSKQNTYTYMATVKELF